MDHINYPTLEKFCSDMGYNKSTIRGYIKTGVWLSGQQYMKPAGLILINIEGYYKWVEGESESKRQVRRVSKSRSPIAASGVGRALSSSPAPLT